MFRKTAVIISLLIFSLCVSVWAGDASDCIKLGRSYMFDGTVSGLRLAYQTFDNCLNDPYCPDCGSNKELKFLHALTRTTMLVFRDDGGSVNSALELARQFALELVGDSFTDSNGLEIVHPYNAHDAYEIPAGAPDINEISDIIDTSMIPEIDAIIAELNSVTDSPGDRFRIFFDPNETHIFDPCSLPLQYDLEVDYGEVLMLKGLLSLIKSRLQEQAAYDTFFDANDMIVEKIYGGTFNMNADLLDPHPDFLKVLPTPGHPGNGKAILAQAAQNLVNSINYYLDAVNYIRSENVPPGTDPQEDEFIYIDPNDRDITDTVNARLTTMRNSLINDVVGTYPWRTTKIYYIQDPGATTTWELTLNYDIIGLPDGDGAGSFIASDSCSAPSPWEVTGITIDVNEIILDMEYAGPDYGGALFTGILSEDGNSITNGTFEYWGPDFGTRYNLFGQLTGTVIEQKLLDLNPLYGSTARYPNPVNLRDLLPQFDNWNGALPNTVGKGLGYDATLGGILPGVTQRDWQVFFELQPAGLFYLQEIYPWQRDGSGYVGVWFESQLVFRDIIADTWEGAGEVNNVDIDSLYMGYDDNYLYGEIILHDYVIADANYKQYDLFLSYSPDDSESLDSIRLDVSTSGGGTAGQLYYNVGSGYGSYWMYMCSFNARKSQNGIEFYVPWWGIPSYLPGRFVSIESSGRDIWYNWDGEDNYTHMQIGEVGSISGTISYPGWNGAPIFVQACTNPADAEGSVVASTMITEPGPYTLEGIGLGWDGYVRAFTPLFGFDNIFELGVFDVEASRPVFLWLENLSGVDITLNNPVLLQKDDCVSGAIDVDTCEVDWYAFDAAQGGTYTLDLSRGTASYASMTLYGRDGDDELMELRYWQTQQIDWLCPVSGRYYVKVANDYYEPAGGTYQICMTSDTTSLTADIAGPGGVGVKDCKVDYYDLAVVASNWLDSCSGPDWCQNSDFNRSGSVNFKDFAVLANEWLDSGLP